MTRAKKASVNPPGQRPGGFTRGTEGPVARPAAARGGPPRQCEGRPGICDAHEDVGWLVIRGARHHNLRNIDVEVPLGRFVCVTGVSGSGKSSLVNDIIREQLAHTLNGVEKVNPGAHDAIEGAGLLDKVIAIDQSPIGRTPRSNPATYVKVFDEVRRLFAKLPDSRVRGYQPGRFSFNVPTGEKGGGRCEACEGNGANRVEMDFLADVWVPCPVCGGRRFNHETLRIRYKGKSIHDVLDMDVQEALRHFAAIPKVRAMLATLHDVGLDYLKLGQSSTTLSGGEAQRIKLARELVRRPTRRTLYLFDEPTTGLHFEDIRRLLIVLHGFVDAGHSVIVIEHNLDVIKTADWVIDLGPEGGDGGGRVVVAGTPEVVAACRSSYTGVVLKDVLSARSAARRAERSPSRRQGVQVRSGRVGGSRSRAKADSAASGKRNEILVVGAREHNLKDVTVGVPRGKLTVCSGVSGSGKSSLAMDTIYTEGQRRYVESLSAYARQFLGQFQKPKVDHVYGLSPAIAIEQKAAGKSPRSTVGTVTEIYDYMRVLWARVGRPHCPRCRVPVGAQGSEEIVDRLLALPAGSRLMLCAPVERGPGESWTVLLERCRSQGYVRVRVDAVVKELSSELSIDARRRHAVELVVDRVVVRPKDRARLADSVEHCLTLGRGVLLAVPLLEPAVKPRRAKGPKGAGHSNGGVMRFSQHLSCNVCGTSLDEITPNHLSFNARLGWCPSCEGLGVQRGTRASEVIVRPDASILSGAVAGWEDVARRPLLRAMLLALANEIGADPNEACASWSAEQRHVLLFGLPDRWIEVAPVTGGSVGRARSSRSAGRPGVPQLRFQWKGFFPAIDEATKSSWAYRAKLQDLAADVTCQVCGGSRIRPEAAAVRLGGAGANGNGASIVDVTAMSLFDAAGFFKSLKLDRREARIAGELLHEIKARLRFLIDVGLAYLTLGRGAASLSGGESQRIRLASQVGSGLTGVLYVLDEPTIGLHPRDNRRLIGALHKLRDLGNTLLMVEHDREVIQAADHIVDFGPGAGAEGGHVVGTGSPAALKRQRASVTGRYLAGREAIAVPLNRRPVVGLGGEGDRDAESRATATLTVCGARENNLRGIDVSFPLGRFVCVTGVSGSGKSSLVSDILHPALASRIHRARVTPGAHDRLDGLDHVDKVINVDQQPVGNSPSSNAATYTGLFDVVRETFARLPDSRIRGYTSNRFSFNRPGGRCDDCDGLGQVCHEMHFLPDVWVPCETCGGTRYQRETLEVRYKGKNIADVLDMQVSEALAHFAQVPKVRRPLQTLEDVGLGYLPLGQSAPTLSGGEAQRVKLAAELGRPNTGKTLYLLDEPTTGLHFDDLRKLLDVLHRLVDLGNTVVCIEHNLDVIKTADWIIDLGPEAGDDGGLVVAAGPPEAVAKTAASHTGRILRAVLEAGPRGHRDAFDPRQVAAPSARDLVGEAPRIKMPWERDGRRWHTETRLGRDGQPVRWEGRALTYIVERMERLGRSRLLPAQWNDRARVEIKAKAPRGLSQSAVPWFCHALTGGRWLLDLLFRISQGTFTQAKLSASLKLETLDDRDDVEAYGQAPRVQVRHAIGPMDQVRLLVHDRREIATAGFRAFLSSALEAYLSHVERLAGDVAGAEPWKTDGKAWHLSQKSVGPKAPKLWKPLTLMTFLGMVQKAAANVRVLWDRKVFVELVTADGGRVGKVITNKGEALRVDVHVPRGRFTPTQVEHLGSHQEFARPGSSGAELTFWFQSTDEIHGDQLRSVLQAAAGTAGGASAAAGPA